MKTCKACQQLKDDSEYYRNRKSHDGMQSSCKPCTKALLKAWAKANPARMKEAARRRQQEKRAREDHAAIVRFKEDEIGPVVRKLLALTYPDLAKKLEEKDHG